MTEAAAVGESVAQLSPVAQRDWRLWVDWCTATNRDPGKMEGEALAAFLGDLPATTQMQDRRLRNIHRALAQPVTGLPRPTTRVPARLGSPWLPYPEALGALRHEWFPEGVAARRDALILVLAAHGFTRRRIRRLQPHVVEAFPDFTVDGLPLPAHPHPALCPRCALTRWLAVLDAYRHRSGRDIEDLLTDARTHSTLHPAHDCLTTDLTEGWWHPPWLICPIDRHGALTPDHPVTRRALTAILTRRFTRPSKKPPTAAEPVAIRETSRPADRRLDRRRREELDELYTKIEADADALNARIQALLKDAD